MLCRPAAASVVRESVGEPTVSHLSGRPPVTAVDSKSALRSRLTGALRSTMPSTCASVAPPDHVNSRMLVLAASAFGVNSTEYFFHTPPFAAAVMRDSVFSPSQVLSAFFSPSMTASAPLSTLAQNSSV
ncbi:hypothetical protein OMP40_11865 [Cohnella rhizosphaerae]|uniref:Uncharacterized protein n=1 Tax=Cohnella rhizosphaerae TaxID=1457232 RepID=A0A9X4KXR4_9BACL|nr:hypothetical protein [Cohnella rhizosphaerae]MDG0809962.1 hypothetical protein [Cohnella rhizosphaerae]